MPSPVRLAGTKRGRNSPVRVAKPKSPAHKKAKTRRNRRANRR